MPRARKGSILFTSVSMIAVFMTMIVAATQYVQDSTRRANQDRWRDVASEAARSGMDFVMGWAQQNIDRETKLPASWAQMNDGDVLDPVSAFYVANRTTITANNGETSTLYAAAAPNDGPGQVLDPTVNNPIFPVGTPSTNVGEYVLARQGDYIVTFKSRIQQFQISNDQPRQFRVGVVGRVRRLVPMNKSMNGRIVTTNINTKEQDTIVAERLLTANMGQVPVSRYATLIDIDGVKNWVPGEIVTGPVHVNRGYVDSSVETTSGLATGTPYLSLGANIATDTINYVEGPLAGGVAGSNQARNIRSVMNLRTSANSPFAAVTDPAPPAGVPGTLDTPVFLDTVTFTAMTSSSTYTNRDSNDFSTGIQLDNNPFCGVPANALVAAKIFKAPLNQVTQPAPMNLPGPVVTPAPVLLPTSVRNRLGTILGIPMGQSLADYCGGMAPGNFWQSLPDGLYIPTAGFWSLPGWGVGAAPNNAYNGPQAASGGIYIRGNVEVMRMGVGTGAYNGFSYYLFTLGYGGPYAAGGVNPKRSYAVLCRRSAAPEMWVVAYPQNAVINGLTPNNNNGTSAATLFGAAPPGVGAATVNGYGTTVDPNQFAIAAGGGPVCAHFAGGNSGFPFNGVVFVDISQKDPARVPNPLQYATSAPLTGNIFALGDPGGNASYGNKYPAGGSPQLATSKRALDGNTDERVATFQQPSGAAATNAIYASPASRLTIMATGNIFIQNNIFLESLRNVPSWPNFTGATASGINVDISKDLVGLVADKQVVFGLAAPSVANPSAANRNQPGLVVHAAIAALGDPAFNYQRNMADGSQMGGNPAYRGSVGTEGLMQYYNLPEQYLVCNGYGGLAPAPIQVYARAAITGVPNPIGVPPYAQPDNMGYPGNPLYQDYGLAFGASFLDDPNATTTRGRAIVVGSVTQKKRGILGKGDTSYDKRFIFDKRMLTLAPPVFPSSTNIVNRTQAIVTPVGMPYISGGAYPAAAPNPDYNFMR